jgi:hypothetical protein
MELIGSLDMERLYRFTCGCVGNSSGECVPGVLTGYAENYQEVFIRSARRQRVTSAGYLYALMLQHKHYSLSAYINSNIFSSSERPLIIVA